MLKHAAPQPISYFENKSKLYFDCLWSEWEWLYREMLCFSEQLQSILVGYQILVLFIVFEPISPLSKRDPGISHISSVINVSNFSLTFLSWHHWDLRCPFPKALHTELDDST